MTNTWTDRHQHLDGVMQVTFACIHFIRDLWVWRLNLATTAVDVPELAEEPKLLFTWVCVISETFGTATNVPTQKEDGDEHDEDFEEMDKRDWIVAETEVVEAHSEASDEVTCR